MKWSTSVFFLLSIATTVWCDCGCKQGFSGYTSSVLQPDENGIIEGDIKLSPKQIEMAKHPRFRNMITSATDRWPGGVVPFKITDWRHKLISWSIKSALNKLSERTNGCVRFREATDDDENFVNIIYGNGCHSLVGRHSYMKGQELSLGFGCELHPIIQHEFMHALGINHEQARPDRDEHIDILWENIDSSACHNFKKWGRLPPLPYDLDSVMHYGSKAFSCSTLTKSTMKTKDGKTIGGALGGIIYPNSVTDLDAKKIKWLYECE